MENVTWELAKAAMRDKQREAEAIRLANEVRRNSHQPSLFRSLVLFLTRL
jgi:hypothetical protein